MITEEQIPEIVRLMNNGDEIPLGVEPISISDNGKEFTVIYFEGLGTYKVNEDPIIKLISEEQSKIIKS